MTGLIGIIPFADRIEQQDHDEPYKIDDKKFFAMSGYDKEKWEVLTNIPHISHRVPVRKKENHRNQVYKVQVQDVIEECRPAEGLHHI